MSRLLRRANRRWLGRHPWQLALSIVGVALGVAVVVSIDLANGSARRAFDLSAQAVTGKATHRIVAGSTGLPEALYRELRVEQGVRPSAPVVEGLVTLADRPERTFRLLGVDPFAEEAFRSYVDAGSDPDLDLRRLLVEPATLLLAAEVAADLELAVGDCFGLEVAGVLREARLGALLSPSDALLQGALADLMLADLSTAQELLGLEGRLTHIDLIRPAGESEASFRDRLRELLPPDGQIVAASSSGETAQQMTRAFRLNLQALSLLALLCGAFLIYNTMTFAVLQRRPLLGTLRTLGTTRREVFALVLGEAAAIGLVGTLLGTLAGIGLGRYLVGLVSQTINDLYFAVSVREVALDGWSLAKGGLLGLGATLLATLAPAYEATGALPGVALARSEIEGRVHRAVPRASAAGGLLLGLGLMLLLSGGGIAFGFGGLFAVLLGCALLTPAATLLLMRALEPLAGLVFGRFGRMATRGVSAALSRTAVAIAALMMAVSVTVGVDLMIRSFRQTVDSWLAYSLPADLYLTVPGGGPGTAGFATVDLERLQALHGVDRVNSLRYFEMPQTGGGTRRGLALDLDQRSYGAFSFKAGEPDAIWPAFQRGEAVLVSEPWATRYGNGVGSMVELRTPAGVRRLPVAGIYYDYSSDQGLVMLSRDLYRRLWDDPTISAMSLFAADAIDLETLAAAARAEVGKGRRLQVRTTRGLREASLEVFDRTFAITGVLRLLAVLVAFIGVLSALMALQLERVRELGVLRAQGLTRGQLWRLVVGQTGLMGITAGLLAMPVGLALAAIMAFVINRRSFGWTLELAVSPRVLAGALLLAVGAALLAGVQPAYRMARTPPAEALREE